MFGWVDFSDEERRRAAEVMNLVRYPGAIDELGFGILRDALADKLFPATSTLHTHARYYYLVAYLMKDIERQGAGRSLEELQAMLRDGEMQTCRRLVAWSKQHAPGASGITGSDSLESGWIKMTPASMDWAAIQRFGLIKDPSMKLRGFLQSVSSNAKGDYASLRDEEQFESDADYSYGSLWDVPFATYKRWRDGDELPLWLEPSEAADLKARIQRLFPGTAYALIVDHDSPEELSQSILDPEFNSVSFISFVESNTLEAMGCSPELIELSNSAANLSSFVSLMHIRFNHLLRRKAEVPEFETNWASRLWQRYAYDASSVYHRRTVALDVAETFRRSGVSIGHGRNFETYRFINAARNAYLQHDLGELDSLIEKREKHLKGEPRSKIANAKAYANEWFGGLELTYRLQVALMVASEINMSLEAVDD